MGNTHEKVKFETNVPVEVKLASPEGKVVQGQFGEAVLYTLEDNRLMFVPPTVRDRIASLSLKPGQTFTICKKEVAIDGKMAIEWQVTRSNGHRETNTLPTSVEAVRKKLEAGGLVLKSCGRLANETGFHLSFTGGEIVNVFDTGTVTIQGKNSDRTKQILGSDSAEPQGAIQDKPPEQLSSEDVPKQNAMKSGNGNGQQSGGASKSNGNGYERMSQIMQISLQYALEAASATERYAQEIGFNDSNGDPFRFSHADIRAVGLSLFIEARRRANGY